MSAPETKARPPAPLTTMTRIASSRSKSSMMRVTASHISSETALCRAGLLKIRRPMRSAFSAIILLVIGSSSMVSLPLNDFTGAQIGDRRVVVAKPAQYLLRMLTELGGRAQLFRLRRAGHIDRLADGLDRAELRVIDRPRHFEVLDLRVGKGLVDRVDRAARDADLVHQFHPIGGRTLFGDLADPFVERLAVLRALRPRCVIGIVEQRHRIGRLAKATEHVVAGGGDVDLPVR